MKKNVIALAIGIFAVSAAIAVPAYACKGKVVRCWYDKVAKKTVCATLCGGSLLLN